MTQPEWAARMAAAGRSLPQAFSPHRGHLGGSLAMGRHPRRFGGGSMAKNGRISVIVGRIWQLARQRSMGGILGEVRCTAVAASLAGVRGLVAMHRGLARMSTLRRCMVQCVLSASMAEGMAALGIAVTFLDRDSVLDSKLCAAVLAADWWWGCGGTVRGRSAVVALEAGGRGIWSCCGHHRWRVAALLVPI
jgi:hypothetical protein